MHIVVIAYLFVILMMSITYYPDIPAMLLRLFGLGILPVWLWLKLANFIRSKPADPPARPATPSARTDPDADRKRNAPRH